MENKINKIKCPTFGYNIYQPLILDTKFISKEMVEKCCDLTIKSKNKFFKKLCVSVVLVELDHKNRSLNLYHPTERIFKFLGVIKISDKTNLDLINRKINTLSQFGWVGKNDVEYLEEISSIDYDGAHVKLKLTTDPKHDSWIKNSEKSFQINLYTNYLM